MKIHCQCLRAILFCLLCTLTVTAIADPTATPERVLWDKRPISVHIQVGSERIIHFPDDIRYWLPDSLKHKVTALAANGVLYLRAREVFPSTRIRVQSLVDQGVFLLDVMADEAPSVSDELIVMTTDSVANLAKNNHPEQAKEDWRVRLTRYAAQQLYAPERLLGGDSGIQRIPIAIVDPVPLIRGSDIEARPIAAWQGGGLTVTAIKLRNRQPQPLTLSFKSSKDKNKINLSRQLRGNWLTATTQHSELGRAGQPVGTTTLYLVSERPFVESLGLPLHQPDRSGDDNDG